MGVKERPFCRFWIGPTVAEGRALYTREKDNRGNLPAFPLSVFSATKIGTVLLPGLSLRYLRGDKGYEPPDSIVRSGHFTNK